MGVMRSDNPGLVRAAIEKGMLLFDTAHGYQRGKNEEMLGEVFKGRPRDSFVLATKIPPEDLDNRSGLPGSGTTVKAFLDRLDISLKRLQMDHVDILYVHGLSTREAVLFPQLLEAVSRAKKEGKARFVGVSTHRNEPLVIQAAIDSGVYNVVLASVNFTQAHYSDVKAAIARAGEAGIGIVAMKTMAGGYFDREKTKPVNCKAALKFVLQDENVTTSIPGITGFDQLEENASVNLDIAMSPEEREHVSGKGPQGSLYCQGCETCVPGCPRALPIPDIMRAFMYTYGYGRPDMARSLLKEIGVSDAPCSGCSSCSVGCAQGFPVRQRVTDVSRVVNVPEEFLA
jgi:predicted aldo/keto reductase-like oxidoreductase